MQKLGVYVRSKVPVFVRNNDLNEESILMSPTTVNYSTQLNHDDDDEVNYQNIEHGAHKQTDHVDLENDLYSYSEKSNNNRINEWQAAWNVTNAIQVILNQNFVRNIFHLKCFVCQGNVCS